MIEVNKNIVFCITHGRTGTTMVTEVFKIFDDTRSEHEPEPNYSSVLPGVKENPRSAIAFLEKKIEWIRKVEQSNYVETSNVFAPSVRIDVVSLVTLS